MHLHKNSWVGLISDTSQKPSATTLIHERKKFEENHLFIDYFYPISGPHLSTFIVLTNQTTIDFLLWKIFLTVIVVYRW